MFASIKLNLNGLSREYTNAAPRLKEGLNNIAEGHNASGTVSLFNASGTSRVTVEIRYNSGALLRDVALYLDEMQVLD